MIHLDLNKSSRFTPIMIIIAVIMIGVSFCSSRYPEPKTTECEKCAEYKEVIQELMRVIEKDQKEWYEEVLCETDLWLHIDELLNEPAPLIKDSIYRELRIIFPDLPAEQAIPDTKPTW